MTLHAFIARALLPASLAACTVMAAPSAPPAPSAPASATTVTTADGTELHLPFQASLPLPGGRGYVQFAGFNDTRCPSDVMCAVAGEATAILWVTGLGPRGEAVTLPWSGGSPDWGRHSARAGGFEFLLVSLEPRPLHAARVDPSTYRAVVRVRPAGRRADAPASPGK